MFRSVPQQVDGGSQVRLASTFSLVFSPENSEVRQKNSKYKKAADARDRRAPGGRRRDQGSRGPRPSLKCPAACVRKSLEHHTVDTLPSYLSCPMTIRTTSCGTGPPGLYLTASMGCTAVSMAPDNCNQPSWENTTERAASV